MQGVSERPLQLYFKCYYVVRVTKTFILKDVQTIHRSTPANSLKMEGNNNLKQAAVTKHGNILCIAERVFFQFNENVYTRYLIISLPRIIPNSTTRRR
jgi:hypothetical protein